MIAEADRKLARHRAALEALDEHTDPTVVATWITQTQAERAAAVAQLNNARHSATHLTRDDIARLLDSVTDHLALLSDGDPADKATIYGQMDLKLTYHPAQHLVRAEAQPRLRRVGDP